MMKLEDFIVLHKKISRRGKPYGAISNELYNQYDEAIESSEEIRTWYYTDIIKKTKRKIKPQCCLKMKYYLTFDKRTKEINPDAIIRVSGKTNDYGIPIHDGGSSFIKIDYCPWCGKALKGSFKGV